MRRTKNFAAIKRGTAIVSGYCVVGADGKCMGRYGGVSSPLELASVAEVNSNRKTVLP